MAKITFMISSDATLQTIFVLPASAPTSGTFVTLKKKDGKRTGSTDLEQGKHHYLVRLEAGAPKAAWKLSVQRDTKQPVERTGELDDEGNGGETPEAFRLIQEYFPRRAAWYFSLKGDPGPETFKFVNANTFGDAKETRWSTSGSVIVGFLTAHNVYLAGRVRYDHSYEAAKTQALCSIGALDQKTACPQKIVGEPKPKTLKVTEGEVRRYLTSVSGLNVGASWIMRRDWEERTTSLEVPLYFVKDKDGGLSGGVSIGYLWSKDPDGTGSRFTVFVGQAFTLGG
jgi:hypothetical protein